MVDRGVAEQRRRAAGPEPSPGEVVIRRTSTGWRVEGAFPTLPTDTLDELGHALVLADLLAEGTSAGPRPPRPADGVDEATRLKASVRQLEHALTSRVVVEQAIGVLTERWSVAPQDAFERLRRVTRSHGLRIHELAKLVIDSTTDPEVGLPAELAPVQHGSDEPPEASESPDAQGPSRPNRRPEPVPAANGGRSQASAPHDRPARVRT